MLKVNLLTVYTVHLLTEASLQSRCQEKKEVKIGSHLVLLAMQMVQKSLRFSLSESQSNLAVSENKVPRIVVFIIVIIRLPGWWVFTLRSELISFSSTLSLKKPIFCTLIWVKLQDIQFKCQNRNILLLIDNFTGHKISYTPSNMHLEFFEPNMMTYVQPLDAEIIWCVKAHYRWVFCLHMIELNDASEDDIYKINLLKVMLMVKEAWKPVTPKTIVNCWNHMKIQNWPVVPATSTSSTPTLTAVSVAPTTCSTTAGLADNSAWEILREFANGTISSLPQTESCLQDHLANHYRFTD